MYEYDVGKLQKIVDLKGVRMNTYLGFILPHDLPTLI